jgi:hypothetical protein
MKVYIHEITQWKDEAFHVKEELAKTLEDVLKEENDICSQKNEYSKAHDTTSPQRFFKK